MNSMLPRIGGQLRELTEVRRHPRMDVCSGLVPAGAPAGHEPPCHGTSEKSVPNADELARRARLRVVDLAARRPIHLGAALSLADVLAVLYTGTLRYDPARPDW